eukprot:7649_1
MELIMYILIISQMGIIFKNQKQQKKQENKHHQKNQHKIYITYGTIHQQIYKNEWKVQKIIWILLDEHLYNSEKLLASDNDLSSEDENSEYVILSDVLLFTSFHR